MNGSPVLVTGAGQRLGLAIALHLQAKGLPVLAVYRSEKPGVETMRQAGITCLSTDLANAESLDYLIKRVSDITGCLRAIIHCAGSWIPESPDVSPEETFNQNFSVHALAPYRINLGLESQLLAQPDNQTGDIIHITDYVAARGSREHIAYAASKAALENMTLSFAARLAPTVKVNSIAPALLMFREEDDEAYRSKAASRSLLPPDPGEEEALRALDLLMASEYITGRTLHLDGGRPLVYY